MGTVEPDTKNDCAGEGQQQITTADTIHFDPEDGGGMYLRNVPEISQKNLGFS
jgi:hypothetical protein